MSRLAKKPVLLKEGVVAREASGVVTLTGPKGERVVRANSGVRVRLEAGKIWVEAGEGAAQAAAGTTWAHLRNAAEGVSAGFMKALEIEGVGYRASIEGSELVLSLGFVNPVRLPIPKGIAVVVEKGTLKVSGIDKELVGEMASLIRAQKKPEPYKGKGIHYRGEVIRRKVGKKAAAAAGPAA